MHHHDAKRLLRYLKQTASLEICFGKLENSGHLTIYADADYAGDQKEKRSASGVVAMDRNGASVAWKSMGQPVTTRSTAEAEFIATAMAMEWIWISDVEKEFTRDDSREPVKI